MKKWFSVITAVVLTVLLAVGAFAVEEKTDKYEFTGETDVTEIDKGCVIRESSGDITQISFIKKDKSLCFYENITNSANYEKLYSLNFTFYDENNEIIENKRVSVSVERNSTIKTNKTELSIPVRRNAKSYFVSYSITGDIPIEHIVTDADKARQKRESSEWYIERSVIKVKITETNQLYFSETIDAVFNENGIDTVVKVLNKKGFDNIGKVKMNSVTCDGKKHFYTLDNKDASYYTLPINTSTGKHSFNFVYTYTLKKDTTPNYDAVKCVLLNGGWSVPIEHLQFEIEFPKMSKYLTNDNITINGTNAVISVESNKISGTATNISDGQTLDLQLNLENGYFIANENDKAFSVSILCGLLVIFSFSLCFISFKRRGEQNLGEIIPEYDRPEKLAYKLDYSHNKSVAAGLSVLLLQLKECVKVEKSPVGNGYIFTKIKEYDGDNAFVKRFVEKVFNDETEADIDDIKERINRSEYMQLVKLAENEKDCSGLFAKTYQRSDFIKSLIIVFVISLIAVAPFIIDFFNPLIFIILGIISLVLLPLHALIFSSSVSLPIKSVLVFVAEAINIMASSSITMGFAHIKSISSLATQIGVLVIFYVGLYIVSLYAPNSIERTVKGIRAERETEGHRKFIEEITPSLAQSIISKDENYFKDMLPYTFIFGEETAEKFTEKFKDVEMYPKYIKDRETVKDMLEFSKGLYSALYEHFNQFTEKGR